MGLALARRTLYAPALAALALALAPAAAHALPSNTPDESAFVPNSDVFAIARSGGLTYIGGAFTELRRQTGGAAQVSTATGDVINPSPEVDGTVHAVAPDGSGGYYLGGSFSAVGGVERDNIAHVLADGSVDAAFDPQSDDSVLAIAISGNDVYVGGEFTQIGGQLRNRIAKLSAASGNAFSAWNPNASGIVNALAVSGSALYVGGQFTTDGVTPSIGGHPRNRIAKLSTTSGNAFSAFNPDADNTVLAIAVSGNDVYAGGGFTNMSGGRIAKLSATDGSDAPGWAPSPNGSVSGLAVSGSALYAGGGFNQIEGTARQRVAKVSTTSGNLFSFDPGPVAGAVSAVAVDATGVYVGGSFTTIGGQERNRAAKLSTLSGNAFSAWDANADSSVNALAVSGSELYVGGAFGSLNEVTRNRIAALDAEGLPTDFDPNADATVKTIAVSGNEVYAGGEFTTIGGQPRESIAKLSAASGNAFSGFNAGDVSGGLSDVNAIAVSGTDVYVGGSFTQIGGQPRDFLAKLSATSGNAFSGWNPNSTPGANVVNAIAVSGTDVYVGGGGDIGTGSTPRGQLNKLYGPTGNAFSGFNANVTGDAEVHSLAVDGTDLYVGGDFTGTDTIGGADRDHIAQLYTVTGNAFSSFDAGTVTGSGPLGGRVNAIGVSGSDVYAGGEFEQIGGASRNRLAALFADNGNAFSSFDPNLDDPVRALTVEGDDLYVGGGLFTVGGTNRSFYAQFTGP